MVITRKLKLYPPNKEKQKILEKTALLQSECVNFWIDKIRERKITNRNILHHAFYYEAKDKFDIGSVLVQLALSTAIAIARALKRKRSDTPYLKQKIITLLNMKIEKNNIGLLLGTGKRMWIPFHSQEIPKGAIRESTIKKIDDAWYCFLNIKIEEPKLKKYNKVLGVDLGIAKVAVVSDKKGKNNIFFRGEPLQAVKHHYFELRKRLQPKLKQGNVYKLLKRIKLKEHNWTTDMNHKISRQIVDFAIKKKSHLAVEKLTGITERLKFNKKTRRMIKGWSFRQLQKFISYKAHQSGLEMFSVDPRGTSKTCPKCGHTSRYNRRSQSRFKCRRCNYESNADRVGAINISLRATGLSA